MSQKKSVPKGGKTATTKKSKPKEMAYDSELEEMEQNEEEIDLEEKIEKVMKKVMNNFKTVFKKEWKEELKELKDAMSFNSDKLDEVLDELKEVKEKQKILEAENKTLKAQLKAVHTVVEDLEQYTRNRNIQVDGIPEEKEENLREIMIDIGQKIDVKIENDMMDAIHRIPSQNERNSPIVVQFTTRQVRDSIMTKVKKTKITTRDLGRQGDEKIVFVNEHLTKKKKQIMFEARKLKKEREYKFLWTKNAKIFIRKAEKTPVIELKDFDDLERIK